MAAVSDFALIVLVARKGYFDQCGINPIFSQNLPVQVSWDAGGSRGDRLGWCNVIAWNPLVLPRLSPEVLLDELLSPRQSVAPAHAGDYASILITVSTQSSHREDNGTVLPPIHLGLGGNLIPPQDGRCPLRDVSAIQAHHSLVSASQINDTTQIKCHFS